MVTWALAAKEAFGGFLTRLVREGTAGAQEPLTRELEEPGEGRSGDVCVIVDWTRAQE